MNDKKKEQEAKEEALKFQDEIGKYPDSMKYLLDELLGRLTSAQHAHPAELFSQAMDKASQSFKNLMAVTTVVRMVNNMSPEKRQEFYNMISKKVKMPDDMEKFIYDKAVLLHDGVYSDMGMKTVCDYKCMMMAKFKHVLRSVIRDAQARNKK